MNSLNSILIEGTVSKEPVITSLDGNSWCDFVIETKRTCKNRLENSISYFEIEAWGRLGEVCAKELKTGSPIRAVGRLKLVRWTTEDREEHSKVKIVAEHIEFKSVRDYQREAI